MTTDVSEYPMGLSKFKEELQGRSMLVKRLKMVEAECIVRGYLEVLVLRTTKPPARSAESDCLRACSRLKSFRTHLYPSTKASEGHDINVSFDYVEKKIGKELAAELKEKSLALYNKASQYALSRGIILADSKFEFGIMDGRLVIADELFTPDSSRFWELSDYKPGKAQKSFDKQYLREYLETLDWDKKPPAPNLPRDVIEKTEMKYIEAYERITGKKFEP